MNRHLACRSSRLALLLVLTAAGVGLPAPAALATFPGNHDGAIAFDDYVSGTSAIWTVNPDGSGRREVYADSTAVIADPAFSNRGASIAFVRSGFSGGAYDVPPSQIEVVSAHGGIARAVTSGHSDVEPTWSVDGAELIFVRIQSPPGDGEALSSNLFSVPTSGGTPIQLTHFPPHTIVSAPTFSAVGRVVFAAMPPTADPNLPTYLYEMDPSGGDLHAITSGESEDNDPDTRVNPTDSTDLIYAHAPSPYVTPAFQERYAPAGGDFGSAGTLGISGFSPRLSPASSSEIAYIGPSANDVLLKPSNFRVTWDSGLKNHISWAAATEPLTARGAPYGFVHLPTAGDRVVPGWVDCLHRTGCIDALRLLVGPRHLLAVRRFSLKYQTGREVSFQLNNKQRKLEALGTRLRLQLVEKAGGQVKHQSMQSVRLRFASSLSATGPANAQANKRLLLHGRLSLQSAGVSANASSNANRSVSIVATSSLGELRSLKAKTGKNGGYSVRFAPDTPGIWRIVAMWPGASTHAGDTSAVLHVHIKPPARLATRLTIGCPGKLAQKSPLHVSGDISPALYHAAITITYTPPGETAVRHSVTTNIVGHYSDSIIESHAGTWTTQASFAGGGSYGPSRSAVCHTTVIRPA